MTSDMHVAGHLTALGWTMCGLYLVAAGLSFRAASICRAQPPEPALGRVWICQAIILAALGLNKPFDLQTRLIGLGRQIARQAELPPSLPGLHLLFFLASILGIAALGALILFRWRIAVGRFLHRLPWAAAGCGLICVYIVIRAVNIASVDQMLGMDWENLPCLWLLEAGGLVLIMAQALHHPTRERRP